MPHEFEVIEDAVLSALEPLKDLGVRTVEFYTGELDVPSAEIVARIMGRQPSIFVIVNGMDVEPANQYDLAIVDITLLIAARHLRGPNRAARGDAGPGPLLYDLLTAVRQTLNGKQIVDGWSALAWTGDYRFLTAPQTSLCLYTSDYQTRRPLRR
jgi:phage gp37-like protein